MLEGGYLSLKPMLRFVIAPTDTCWGLLLQSLTSMLGVIIQATETNAGCCFCEQGQKDDSVVNDRSYIIFIIIKLH